jgi:hypothetical protein
MRMASTALYLAVDTIVDVCGPDAREKQQHLEGQEVRRDEEQRHAVRECLQQMPSSPSAPGVKHSRHMPSNQQQTPQQECSCTLMTAVAQEQMKRNLCCDAARHLQNAVQGVEGEASKGAQRVLLVVLVMNVVQRPAAKAASTYKYD